MSLTFAHTPQTVPKLPLLTPAMTAPAAVTATPAARGSGADIA